MIYIYICNVEVALNSIIEKNWLFFSHRHPLFLSFFYLKKRRKFLTGLNVLLCFKLKFLFLFLFIQVDHHICRGWVSRARSQQNRESGMGEAAGRWSGAQVCGHQLHRRRLAVPATAGLADNNMPWMKNITSILYYRQNRSSEVDCITLQ